MAADSTMADFIIEDFTMAGFIAVSTRGSIAAMEGVTAATIGVAMAAESVPASRALRPVP